MAISQVRAQLNGQWYTLTYNPETRTYQTTITPDVFSGNQPNGYFNVTVEATNDSGVISTIDGSTMQGLRLTVLETIPPTLTLISPAQGYITTNTPSIVFSATDNPDGSGINPNSAVIRLDGAVVPPECVSIVQSGAVYTITYTPSGVLSEGLHTIAASISDNDGNTVEYTATYTVDTVPPELSAELSFEETVTDAYAVIFTGHTSDVTANPVSVTISNNGHAVPIFIDGNGDFTYTLDLAVGENHISINAVDAAGLTTTKEYYIIRLITDRTQSDVDRVNDLSQKMMQGTATAEEQDEWFAGMRGAYNATDLNRVNTAMEYINGWMKEAGYSSGYSDQGIEWTMSDIQVQTQMSAYLNNVVAIGSVFPLENPPILPESMIYFTYIGANAIEKLLVLTDKIHPLLDRSPFYSGEIFCGEV